MLKSFHNKVMVGLRKHPRCFEMLCTEISLPYPTTQNQKHPVLMFSWIHALYPLVTINNKLKETINHPILTTQELKHTRRWLGSSRWLFSIFLATLAHTHRVTEKAESDGTHLKALIVTMALAQEATRVAGNQVCGDPMPFRVEWWGQRVALRLGCASFKWCSIFSLYRLSQLGRGRRVSCDAALVNGNGAWGVFKTITIKKLFYHHYFNNFNRIIILE